MTVEELAAELGIDLATAKPEGLTKVKTYLSDADSKYQTATQAQQQAEAALRSAKAEQDAINNAIAEFGATEARINALEANNAAQAAALKTLKDQGLAVNIPDPVPGRQARQPEAFDPQKFQREQASMYSMGLDVSNKYLALHGKPLPDSVQSLAQEAVAHGMALPAWAAQKYNFGEVEQARAQEAQAAHDAKIRADAIKEWTEAHPETGNNPNLSRGVASEHAAIFKPKDAKGLGDFGRMNPMQKIAASVQKSVAAINANR
jgi:hypothetical protein